ncbi:MAG: alpha-glucosidase [bacterium]
MERSWWKEAVVYQIYPRSYADSNGDGIGDIPGIIAKLDYLSWLGVDVLWLSPIYRSPNDDNGYDISGYQDIMGEFGTMADFDRLLTEAHKRGLKIIMDLVVNHTSDEHPWFVESRSSKSSPKRDWYIWRQPHSGGKPPNNWLSHFSGSAWELDAASGEYYLHLFSRKQPDLNWENPAVRKAVYDMMHWWYRKGIDGFRMDVINMIAKASGLPDAPVPPGPNPPEFVPGPYCNNPGIHDLLKEMNREVLRHYDAMTVGEIHGVNAVTGLEYVAYDSAELKGLFQFNIMYEGKDQPRLRQLVNEWYQAFKGRGWNSITLNNHDSPREVSKFGDDGPWRVESAKLIATFLLTAPGIPYLYQGEEIGMTNVSFDSIDDYRDIEMLNRYRDRIARESADKILAELRQGCRDNARTPMQWTAGPGAGFSTGTPWMKVNPNHSAINVEAAKEDQNSVLWHYKNLLAFRKANPELVYGDYCQVGDTEGPVYAYERSGEKSSYLVILNWSAQPVDYVLPDRFAKGYSCVIASYPTAKPQASKRLVLRPWDACVYRAQAGSSRLDQAGNEEGRSRNDSDGNR